MKKVYFAAALSAKDADTSLSGSIIEALKQNYIVLTEHLGIKELQGIGENKQEKFIHDRDLSWLKESDFVIAEVSNPSLGVGYEIAKALEWNKKVVCLYKNQERKLSSMIKGAPKVIIIDYSTVQDLQEKLFNLY